MCELPSWGSHHHAMIADWYTIPLPPYLHASILPYCTCPTVPKHPTPTMATSITEEIEQARTKFSKIKIPTATRDFCNVLYVKTPTRRVKATLTFPDGYPLVGLIVSVSDVAPGVKKKLEKELTHIAREHVGDEYGQVLAVLDKLQTFMDTNLFVPCWKELRQSVDLIRNLSKSSKAAEGSAILSMNETKGLIKVKLMHAKYHYTCNVTIDEHYPVTQSNHDWGKACLLKKTSTNFPVDIATLLTQTCQDLVRHMQDGMPEQQAFQMLAPTLTRPSTGVTQRSTKVSNKSASTSSQGVSLDSDHKTETWQEEEAKRLSNYEIPTYDGSNPQPSLLSLIKFVIAVIQKFPSQNCAGCGEKIIPADPTALAALYPSHKKPTKAQQNQRPVRPSCGCWYHCKCLDKFLTQPPFGDGCASCGQSAVSHPDWTASRAELEKEWANQQARQREMDDVAMMF